MCNVGPIYYSPPYSNPSILRCCLAAVYAVFDARGKAIDDMIDAIQADLNAKMAEEESKPGEDRPTCGEAQSCSGIRSPGASASPLDRSVIRGLRGSGSRHRSGSGGGNSGEEWFDKASKVVGGRSAVALSGVA